MSNTLIINYAGLSMGGIEETFANLMDYSVNKGYRVIWFTTHNHLKKAVFTNITNNPLIEKYYFNELNWSKFPKPSFKSDESVTMISCEPISYFRAEIIRNNRTASFNHFLILPHFTGNAYFPERYLNSTIFGRASTRFWGEFAARIVDCNSILAFDLKHLNAYEKNYGFKIESKENKILVGITQIEEFDKKHSEMMSKKRRDEFVITTCSRLDFPHKGYINGLIDVFSSVNDEYEQCKLIIVGDGPGKEHIISKIARLPVNTAKKIVMTGTLLPSELKQILKKTHLNIGVAGALSAGAKLGVPSVNVRHYSMECEAYGFYFEKNGKELRNDPGEDITPYIIKCLNASDGEYVDLCKKCYDSYSEVRKYNPEFVFEQKTINPNDWFISRRCKAGFYYYLILILQKLFQIKGYELENATKEKSRVLDNR